MQSNDGQVAIVTGAASGIGRATAILFAERGARVVIADVDEAGAQETLQTVTERGYSHGAGQVILTDVSSPTDAEHLNERRRSKLRGI